MTKTKSALKVAVQASKGKATPFAANFTTKLAGVNSKLVCALSLTAVTSCTDDTPDDDYPVWPGPIIIADF